MKMDAVCKIIVEMDLEVRGVKRFMSFDCDGGRYLLRQATCFYRFISWHSDNILYGFDGFRPGAISI